MKIPYQVYLRLCHLNDAIGKWLISAQFQGRVVVEHYVSHEFLKLAYEMARDHMIRPVDDIIIPADVWETLKKVPGPKDDPNLLFMYIVRAEMSYRRLYGYERDDTGIRLRRKPLHGGEAVGYRAFATYADEAAAAMWANRDRGDRGSGKTFPPDWREEIRAFERKLVELINTKAIGLSDTFEQKLSLLRTEKEKDMAGWKTFEDALAGMNELGQRISSIEARTPPQPPFLVQLVKSLGSEHTTGCVALMSLAVVVASIVAGITTTHVAYYQKRAPLLDSIETRDAKIKRLEWELQQTESQLAKFYRTDKAPLAAGDGAQIPLD